MKHSYDEKLELTRDGIKHGQFIRKMPLGDIGFLVGCSGQTIKNFIEGDTSEPRSRCLHALEEMAKDWNEEERRAAEGDGHITAQLRVAILRGKVRDPEKIPNFNGGAGVDYDSSQQGQLNFADPVPA